MSRLQRRKLWVAGLICGAGTLMQLGPVGCKNYAITSALSAFNFCSVFNCEAGSYFDLCSPSALFVDCPEVAQTTQP